MSNGRNAYLSADTLDGKQVLVRSRHFLDNEGHIKWPSGDGFVLDSNGNPITQHINLKKGQIIDRYGSSNGRFVSPIKNGEVTPFDKRGLPYPEGYQEYRRYRVIKDINKENYFESLNKLSPEDKYQLEMDMLDYGFKHDDIYNLQQGEIAKVFGNGGGIQIRFGTNIKWYEKLNFLEEIK